jgi:hypothetical protein
MDDFLTRTISFMIKLKYYESRKKGENSCVKALELKS